MPLSSQKKTIQSWITQHCVARVPYGLQRAYSESYRNDAVENAADVQNVIVESTVDYSIRIDQNGKYLKGKRIEKNNPIDSFACNFDGNIKTYSPYETWDIENDVRDFLNL